MEKPRRTELFKEAYRRQKFTPARLPEGHHRCADSSGSTAVRPQPKPYLLDENGDILCKSYQLSNGNPIQDTIEMFENLRASRRTERETRSARSGNHWICQGHSERRSQRRRGAGRNSAHTESALKFYEDPHVIVDVGGQDIKIIILHNGRVKDFKLNTQCSAGNGYFLQSTAEGFGLSVNQYADLAFSAQAMPVFGYGCAVFMQSDIVNFQRQGWRAEEILAGLAAVLPKNVFLYVASIPNLAALGSRFVLQGGTQNNLAVVKAEVDFIRNSFRATGKQPEIIVHEHCGESGAIGAAQESLRLWRNGQQTTFVGLDAVRKIEYRTTRNEDTRCHFCKNDCLRTFIDIRTAAEERPQLCAHPKSHEGSADARRATLDYRHMRKGHGRRCQRHEGHQGWAGLHSGPTSEFCRLCVERSFSADERKERGRSAADSRWSGWRKGERNVVR